MKFLCFFFTLSYALSSGCHRSAETPEKPLAEIDQILKQVERLNTEIDVFRANAEKYDEKFKAYRQEMQHLRSQTGAGKKDRKAEIRRRKFFANQAKKMRRSEHLRVQVYTEKVKERVADFDTFFKETAQ